MVLVQRQFWFPENIAKILSGIFGCDNWGGKCYWNLVGRDQGCCSTPCKAQDNSQSKELTGSNTRSAVVEKNPLQEILHTAATVILLNINLVIFLLKKRSLKCFSYHHHKCIANYHSICTYGAPACDRHCEITDTAA